MNESSKVPSWKSGDNGVPSFFPESETPGVSRPISLTGSPFKGPDSLMSRPPSWKPAASISTLPEGEVSWPLQDKPSPGISRFVQFRSRSKQSSVAGTQSPGFSIRDEPVLSLASSVSSVASPVTPRRVHGEINGVPIVDSDGQDAPRGLACICARFKFFSLGSQSPFTTHSSAWGTIGSHNAAVEPDADHWAEKVLGEGAYGVVLKVRRLGTNPPQHYALKLQNVEQQQDLPLYATQATAEVCAERERVIFTQIWDHWDEARGRRGHPFIVRLIEPLNWPNGKSFMVNGPDGPEHVKHTNSGGGIQRFYFGLLMEYCAMGSLHHFLLRFLRRGVHDQKPEQQSRWWLQVRRFTAEIILALDFLHNMITPDGKQIVYRDLKPENVLMAGTPDDPHVKLTDFGSARNISSNSPANSVTGSAYFAPPEMQHIIATCDPMDMDTSIDVHTLGITLFVMAYGCTLHHQLSLGQLVQVDPSTLPVKDQEANSLYWTTSEAKPRRLLWTTASDFPIVSVEEALRRHELDPGADPPVLQPPGSYELVRQIVSKKMSARTQRPKLSQLKTNSFFGELLLPTGKTAPPLDWEALNETVI